MTSMKVPPLLSLSSLSEGRHIPLSTSPSFFLRLCGHSSASQRGRVRRLQPRQVRCSPERGALRNRCAKHSTMRFRFFAHKVRYIYIFFQQFYVTILCHVRYPCEIVFSPLFPELRWFSHLTMFPRCCSPSANTQVLFRSHSCSHLRFPIAGGCIPSLVLLHLFHCCLEAGFILSIRAIVISYQSTN